MTRPAATVARAARVRAYVAGAVVTFGLIGVAMRAWALQIDDGARFHAQAERQQELRVQIPAPRGDIVDAKGRALAVSTDVESIWANPHEVHDVAATAEALANMLGGDASVLEAKLGGDHRFAWIERHVSPEVARKVRAAKLSGIELATEPRRWYPLGAVAGTVLGRADIDGNGVDGVELALNDSLAGKGGNALALRDARGHRMLADGISEPEAGAHVTLSLDRSIQAIAMATLVDAVATNKAASGVVVVLEIGTGRVLALATAPSYDPNVGDPRGARDRPVTDAFEAGSVMKVFSIAAALDAGVVTTATEFPIGGSVVVGGRAIHDVEFDPYLDVAGIIKRSSNVGAAKIALRLGRDKLYDGLKRFGFGAKTGIELPGEQTGRVRAAQAWRDIELAHIAFGYGLTVTPLQVAAGIAAIGDHGVYREPRIVDQIADADGRVLYRGQGAEHVAISPQVADELLPILASVFDKGKFQGTASTIEVLGFRCGGKTGTARKYDPETKQYSEHRYLGSFAGLAPIDHPRLAIVAMIDDPSGGDYYGAKVAGPVFATVASEALRYLGVPGEPAKNPDEHPLPH
jgi:cell division protein FtsI (penicillin-binding protein 3)